MKRINNEGFSLIELIIVIAIMAVLVAIITPNLTKYLSKAKKGVDNKNLDEAFKIAHSLKGVLGNLSITPMYEIAYELTELLRNKKDIDYKEYVEKLLEIRDELLLIIKE